MSKLKYIDSATQNENPTARQRARRPLALILGSALLLGGLYYGISRGRNEPFPEQPAFISSVRGKSDLEHFIEGFASANFNGRTALLSEDPPQIVFFRKNAHVEKMALRGAERFRNAKIKPFNDVMVVCADEFFAFIKNGDMFRILIDDLRAVGKRDIDCTFQNGSLFAIGSGKSGILRRDESKGRYVYPLDDVFRIEQFGAFENPSIASAGGHVFLLSDGMKNIYQLDFPGTDIEIKYESLEKVIGKGKAFGMRMFGLGGHLYIADEIDRVLYKVDPERMQLKERKGLEY